MPCLPCLHLLTICSAPPVQLYQWGGCFRRVPENFEFPKCPLEHAFVLWCLGDQAKGYPPLHLLTPIDLGTDMDPKQADNRRRLSEFRHVMQLLEAVRAMACLSKADTHPGVAARKGMALGAEGP